LQPKSIRAAPTRFPALKVFCDRFRFALKHFYFLSDDDPTMTRIRTAKARITLTVGLLIIEGIVLDASTCGVAGTDSIDWT